jgi:precorrin-2 dehydrogenase / sirohydrochlorin ferrochelatase
MIPLHLDPTQVRSALIGRGELAVRRLVWLREAGATPDIWSDDPSIDLAALAGGKLEARLPHAAELAGYHVLWIADLPLEQARELADAARASRVLVNVEDVTPLCDFHTPAVVRRGALTLTAGTGGASPAVARAAREQLESAFPESWGEALEEIAQSRAVLRAQGARFDALVADARARLTHHGLI